MKTSFFFLLLFILLPLSAAFAQDDCGCETEETTTVCYLSKNDYCGAFGPNCEYTLDGQFFQNGLVAKLQNPALFGENGLSCSLELKRAAPSDVESVEAINDCGCDMFFIGQFLVSDPFGQPDLSQSAVPTPTLNTIREWSLACESNLVIVTQAEANPWGFLTENQNVNPNTAEDGVSISSIFDGPFGNLDLFNQGGSFQGVFTQLPATGVEILANDALGRPTVALDQETNDIILADVGILCSDGAGEVSPGDMVINNNDILATNIFALGCRIAEGVVTSEQDFTVCEGEPVPLPDGSLANAPGEYLDTLAAANGCDSIVLTAVEWLRQDTLDIAETHCLASGFSVTVDGTVFDADNPSGDVLLQNAVGCDSLIRVDLEFVEAFRDTIQRELCLDSGFSLTVNGTVYDQSNPDGVEQFTSVEGCDSIVTVDLDFLPFVTEEVRATACRGESFSIQVGDTQFDETNPSGTVTLQSVFGCDSIVDVAITFFEGDTLYIEQPTCAGDVVEVGGVAYPAGTTTAITLTNQFGCDSLIYIDLPILPLPEVAVDTLVRIDQGQSFEFSVEGDPSYQYEWSPAEALSCANCPAPTLQVGNYPEVFELTVTDTVGCTTDYRIRPSYQCTPYIPNAFSPNGDGRNDTFAPFVVCPNATYTLQVFDRWGNLVFESSESNGAWDGEFGVRPAPAGVYVYVLQLETAFSQETFNGELNLVR